MESIFKNYIYKNKRNFNSSLEDIDICEYKNNIIQLKIKNIKEKIFRKLMNNRLKIFYINFENNVFPPMIIQQNINNNILYNNYDKTKFQNIKYFDKYILECYKGKHKKGNVFKNNKLDSNDKSKQEQNNKKNKKTNNEKKRKNNDSREFSDDDNEEVNNNKSFINEEFYKNFLEESNISINNVDRIDVLPDGNCYMRCVALFIYNNEDEHLRVRNEIANYLSQHSSDFDNIKIPTEEGWKSVKEYINYIKLPGKYSGHLEMYATNILYNINLLSLYDELDNNHQTISFKFCYKFSFDNNMQKAY